MVRPSTRTASGSSSRPARMIVVYTTRTRAVRSSAARSDDSDCSESRTRMRHSNERWNDGLPRAAGSRRIARWWSRPSVVCDGHMSGASSARERATAESQSPTSPESASRRTRRDPSVNSVAASSPYETTRGRIGDSQIGRGSWTAVTWQVDDSAVTRHVRVSLLNTLRYLHHHRLLVVHAFGSCDGAAPVATCHARQYLSQRSSASRSLMRLLACIPYGYPAGGQWRWLRLCRSCVQLSCPVSPLYDGAATVSSSLACDCRGQRLSVRRSLMVAQP